MLYALQRQGRETESTSIHYPLVDFHCPALHPDTGPVGTTSLSLKFAGPHPLQILTHEHLIRQAPPQIIKNRIALLHRNAVLPVYPPFVLQLQSGPSPALFYAP